MLWFVLLGFLLPHDLNTICFIHNTIGLPIVNLLSSIHCQSEMTAVLKNADSLQFSCADFDDGAVL